MAKVDIRRRTQLREASRRYYQRQRLKRVTKAIEQCKYAPSSGDADNDEEMSSGTDELSPMMTSAVSPAHLVPIVSIGYPAASSNSAPKKKATIPKSVRAHIWNHYIGSHINEHRCLCCKRALIRITEFEIGHVQSEADGGTMEITNLRPICAVCNHSMGRMNMIDYIKRYGFYL
jgi:hypothetical protein